MVMGINWPSFAELRYVPAKAIKSSDLILSILISVFDFDDNPVEGVICSGEIMMEAWMMSFNLDWRILEVNRLVKYQTVVL
jgi:hypothetical protein